jgi:hypothetical protein
MSVVYEPESGCAFSISDHINDDRLRLRFHLSFLPGPSPENLTELTPTNPNFYCSLYLTTHWQGGQSSS